MARFVTTNWALVKHDLVGGLNPSEKYEFVSWDDEISNIWKVLWKVIKAMFQSPPSSDPVCSGFVWNRASPLETDGLFHRFLHWNALRCFKGQPIAVLMRFSCNFSSNSWGFSRKGGKIWVPPNFFGYPLRIWTYSSHGPLSKLLAITRG